MKKFETPVVEIEKFEIADVITTSEDVEDVVKCEDETPL